MTDRLQIDWDAAAAQFDPGVKVQSFRTVTARAIKRVQAAAAGGGGTATGNGDAGDDGEPKTKAKGKGGKKRKDAEAEGGDASEKPVKKAKGGIRGKKVETGSKGEFELLTFNFTMDTDSMQLPMPSQLSRTKMMSLLNERRG